MLWFKALHIIAMVCWFAGLFYLPRLYVYHANDRASVNTSFHIMEWRLFWYITTPAGILTGVFGWATILTNYDYYAAMNWLHVKLILVLLLAFFHLYLGKLLFDFKKNQNQHSERFYRYLNEIPSVFLLLIVFLAVLKPF
ncbi:MAG: protoporphyrinogen oxidase HemJ [Gammaproteobacteria bacterium]|nr:protoporphyrinogen oxidase HemJ [Gammaproteobacteria bacterium]MCD8542467.1 protoporphyrinogen oxidase HemJ [Gammaproteobacteria bacterium]